LKKQAFRDQHHAKPSHRQEQYCHAVEESLDISQLTNVPEHLRERCRVHSILPDGGGSSLLIIIGLADATHAEITALEPLLAASQGLIRQLIAESINRKRVPHVKVRVVPDVGKLD
jgi:hypothetical protein